MPVFFSESALPAAAFFFESLGGALLGDYELREIRTCRLEGMDPEELARSLMEWIAAQPLDFPDGRGTAYWALGKKRDKALIPYFRDQLRLELTRDMNAAYQILIALDDVDEPSFDPARGGYSSNEEELNRRDAERYLEAIGRSDSRAR